MFRRHVDVRLSVRNQSRFDVDLQVQIVSRRGQTNQTNHGRLAPTDNKPIRIKLRKGSSYQVRAALPGSAIIFRSGLQTVHENHSATIDVISQARELDDSQSFDQISRSFKVLGEDIGAAPINVADALRTRFGAIVVAIRAAEERPAQIIHVVEPNVLGVKVVTLEDIQYPHTNETQSISISGSAGARASALLGPLAKFGIAWDTTRVYQMKWVLRGFGQINKSEDPAKSYMAQFNALPSERKDVLRHLLKSNPEAQMYYINRMYVIERAEVFVMVGEKQSASAELSAGAVVNASGVYNFDRSSEVNNGYGPSVINYWGDEHRWLDAKRDVLREISPDAFRIFGVDQARDAHLDLLVPTGIEESFSPGAVED